MTNYKEILRLHSLGINNTRIAESCGCARSTVIAALQRAAEQELFWNKIKNCSTETRAFLEQDQELQHRRGRQKVVSLHCTGPAVQDAGLRVGTP